MKILVIKIDRAFDRDFFQNFINTTIQAQMVIEVSAQFLRCTFDFYRFKPFYK